MADEEDRWLVIDGRRWRRTDPALPQDVVDPLLSHLGRARSSVGAARQAHDDAALAEARRLVGIAKRGLGERGPYWWERPEADRIEQARSALADLDEAVGDPPGVA